MILTVKGKRVGEVSQVSGYYTWYNEVGIGYRYKKDATIDAIKSHLANFYNTMVEQVEITKQPSRRR